MSVTRPRARRGFTLLELLMSILVIGVLMGLVITGSIHVLKVVKSTADGQALRNTRQAVEQFRTEFGFLPPLVRDQQSTNNQVVVTSPPLGKHINVMSFTDPTDQTFLRTVPAPSGNNPFGDDRRFSNRSLAIYLAGGMPEPLGGPVAIPMDGVPGPGMYKPNNDGTFNIPSDVLRASTTSRRTGRVYESFVNLSKSSPKLSVDPSTQTEVELRDGRNNVYRYYRWLTGKESVPGHPVVDLVDLNVPYIVGRDPSVPPFSSTFAQFKTPDARNLSANAALRSATWAIVAAGPNGAFGDEPIAQLAAKLGKSYDPGASNASERELELRADAESDNLVEVGS